MGSEMGLDESHMELSKGMGNTLKAEDEDVNFSRLLVASHKVEQAIAFPSFSPFHALRMSLFKDKLSRNLGKYRTKSNGCRC
jgi:hypothetical protein